MNRFYVNGEGPVNFNVNLVQVKVGYDDNYCFMSLFRRKVA